MRLGQNVGHGSDVGRIRPLNEDYHRVWQFPLADGELTLLAVADGMGGAAAGEVASEMAVQIVLREIKEVADVGDGSATKILGEALKLANRAIHDRTITEVDKQGMGTTASVLLLAENRYLIGQVGDSRVYLLRDGTLRQITKDHSFVQEQVDAGLLTPEQARVHPYSNVITRCVGAGMEVTPDIYFGNLQSGDLILLASDGLTGMLSDADIRERLSSGRDLHEICRSLVNDSNARGGIDNVTVVLLKIEEEDDGEDTQGNRV